MGSERTEKEEESESDMTVDKTKAHHSIDQTRQAYMYQSRSKIIE